MKIMLVPSSVSAPGEVQGQFLTSILINDTLAIDAGCAGLYQTAKDQERLKHILISHSHIDHLGSLPILLDNVFDPTPESVTVHGSEAVLECLRKDIFNDRVWPDFIALSRPQARFVKLETLYPGKTVELEGLRITPVSVDHPVPTMGFVVEDQTSAVVFSSDTGPTDELWQVANTKPNLKAVFLEATFPTALSWLARESKHLTPPQFAQECRKLTRPVTVIAVHIKPRYYAQVVAELQALGLPNLVIGKPGVPYVF